MKCSCQRDLVKTAMRLGFRLAVMNPDAVKAFREHQEWPPELAQDESPKERAAAPSGLTIEDIQREVSAYFKVKLHDLKGPRRFRSIVGPRMIAMYLSRKLVAMSYSEIGTHFGHKDRASVIRAIRKIECIYVDPSASNSVLRIAISSLESRLRKDAL